MTTNITGWFINLLGLDDEALEEIGGIDDPCHGFHGCIGRSFESGKEDCEECREDYLNAEEAERIGG